MSVPSVMVVVAVMMTGRVSGTVTVTGTVTGTVAEAVSVTSSGASTSVVPLTGTSTVMMVVVVGAEASAVASALGVASGSAVGVTVGAGGGVGAGVGVASGAVAPTGGMINCSPRNRMLPGRTAWGLAARSRSAEMPYCWAMLFHDSPACTTWVCWAALNSVGMRSSSPSNSQSLARTASGLAALRSSMETPVLVATDCQESPCCTV